MIKEAYCSFELAKLLKEKEFPMNKHLRIYINKDNLCLTDTGMMSYLSKEDYVHFEDFFIPTITHQMAMAWLREVHNKHCDIGYDIDLKWFFQIIDLKEIVEYDYPEIKYYHAENETDFNTYEEAVEAALKYCLENLL